ncbi:MAG: C factor cell-cell signaling protein [Legionellaceae bacterium]|nr:C factor cell-cell signaling protein [Legionellaceae bacterium]
MKVAWIVGEGGIGYAIHQALEQMDYKVVVLSKQYGMDLLSYEAVEKALLAQVDLPSLVINTCGILHDESHMPEKSIFELSMPWLLKSIEVNVSITINLIQVLSHYVSSAHTLQFCAFSARVSSITDNRKGGWYSYRMSKAMLNMLIKNIALEWQVKSPASIAFAYHPGTVDTNLSEPFKKYITPSQIFSPQQAANYFLDVIFDETINKHGKLIDWQGLEILP